MIDACLNTLIRGRLFEKHIFTERFLTAKDGTEKHKSPLFKKI
jgi:phenol hydroxylase P5 protein